LDHKLRRILYFSHFTHNSARSDDYQCVKQIHLIQSLEYGVAIA